MDNETLGAALALAKKTLADPELIEEKVNDWLDDHPEATTTVQDGAISYSKLDSSLKETADEVSQLSNALQATVIQDEQTGGSIEIDAPAGSPSELIVNFEWSQGDITNISPENPVPITTMQDCTITVNETDYETDFTTDIGAAGIGKGTYDALAGKATVTQKAVVVTADMVTGKAKASGDIYAATLNLGTPVYAAGGGVLACSHYKIGQNPGIWLRNGTLYLYGNFPNDLDAIKTYVSGLNMVVVFAIETPIQYNVTAQQVLLEDGENIVSVGHGTLTIAYTINTKNYIDNAVEVVDEKATEALGDATEANNHAVSLQNNVDTINENLYKYRTESGDNTGIGSASASTHIHWGFTLTPNDNNVRCARITILPLFNVSTGVYTATRWRKPDGTIVADQDVLTKVEEKTQDKSLAVSFDNLGFDEFVSFNVSLKTSNSSTRSVRLPLGYIDPETGKYTTMANNVSGTVAIIWRKPIKDNSMLLYGKKITLIGDSITEKNGRANVNHGMWLERWTGCLIQNLGVGGTGFARTPGSTNYKTRISEINPDADIIGVASSFNDMIYTLGTPVDSAIDNTICGYANEFFDTLLELYPTKRIVCYSEGPWYDYHPGITASDNYISAIKTICESKGIVWDDGLYRGCALRPWIQANCEVYYKGESGSYTDVVDNIHPNSDGQAIIARWLEKLFEKVVD